MQRVALQREREGQDELDDEAPRGDLRLVREDEGIENDKEDDQRLVPELSAAQKRTITWGGTVGCRDWRQEGIKNYAGH